MRVSRLFFLLFRYFTLILLGISLASLWNSCQLDYYDFWGKFYAWWIPLCYAFFSTGYVVVAELFSQADSVKGFHRTSDRFRHYDDYTYLLPLWIVVLEISGRALPSVHLWLAISYLGLIMLKGGLFLTYLYKIIQLNPVEITSQATAAIQQIPRRMQWALVLTALLIYSPISAYHIKRTLVTGDEPHYLLITHSLWYDHDTNLYNNYQNRDYKSFYRAELKPTWGDQVSATEIYSYRHKGGFPYTLIPGYVLGGQLGVVLQLNLITAFLMLQVFLLAQELFHSVPAAFFAWLCFAFTIPFIIYMNQIYPETLAALLLIWSLRRIRRFNLEESFRTKRFWRNSLALGLMLTLLVLLKTRYLFLAGTLGLFLLVTIFQGRLQRKQKIRLFGMSGLILFVGALAVFLADHFFFGHMLRDRLTDSQYMRWMLSGYNPLYGLFGLLFDQEYGLLPYTPLYICALAGIGLLTRKEWQATWPLFAMVLLNYGAIGFWPLWHAAPTPPVRYLLPVLPLLGVFAARFFMQPGGIGKVIFLGMSAIWSLLTAWIVTLTPEWRYNWADGVNNLLETLSLRVSVDLTKLFPSWIRISPLTPYLTAFGMLGIGTLIYYCRRCAKKPATAAWKLSIEVQIIVIVGSFLIFSMLGFGIGKKLPTLVLEAEDVLDVTTSGGERVPPTLDPWDNQQYLRVWKYYGWKLFPGNTLQMRPKLFSGKINLEIFARAEMTEQAPAAVPVLLILAEGKEVGRIPVAATAWKGYTFPLMVAGSRPRLEIRHEPGANAKSALIIDKIRFH